METDLWRGVGVYAHPIAKGTLTSWERTGHFRNGTVRIAGRELEIDELQYAGDSYTGSEADFSVTLDIDVSSMPPLVVEFGAESGKIVRWWLGQEYWLIRSEWVRWHDRIRKYFSSDPDEDLEAA